MLVGFQSKRPIRDKTMAFDFTDPAFASPLIKAILCNEPNGVREALSRGYNANLPDNRGWTPIHEAATDDERSDCLKELLVHSSANINAKTFLGQSALFLACQNDCLKAVKLLLTKKRCQVNLSNSIGVSPLHVACNNRNLEIVKCLIEFGALVNSKDFSGYTPLHEAVLFGNGLPDSQDENGLNICHYLLNHGANPIAVESDGNYPFHLACQNGLVKCINLLYTVSKQHDVVNCCNNDGRTPLMLAVASKSVAVVETLLSYGANPNIADNFCITALHLAAHSPNFDIFSMIHKATSKECILKYCTFDEERDFKKLLLCGPKANRINSLVCLAIDTEDLPFLIKVLESDLDRSVLHCPVIHIENIIKKSFTLHTPISFLLESKMCDLGEKTLDFLLTLIDHGSPLKLSSENLLITYISPICAGLVALNDSPVDSVMKCLHLLLLHGADPDEPHGRMPFAMEQACMRSCTEAVLLLLQYSNVLEPEDVLKWIEEETSSGQEKTVEVLLPLAPYYTPSDKLLSDLIDNPLRKSLLTPQVHSLASCCRTIIRKQLHEETKSSPTLFRQKLLDLMLPKNVHLFLNYM